MTMEGISPLFAGCPFLC